MANSDKNILITPNIGQAAQPSIVFTGQGNDPISLRVLDETVGAISFEGSSGQLFGITDNLTSGSIFSVNDVSGIPIIDVQANGALTLGTTGTSVGVGTSSPSAPLHVSGPAGTLIRIDGGTAGTGTRDVLFTEFNTTAYGGIIRYDSANDLFTFGTVENSIVVNAINVVRAGGNVGIGKTNPGAKFEVNGTGTEQVRVFGAGTGYLWSGYDNANSKGRIGAYTGSAHTTLLLNEGGGNVGIGLTDPSSPLEVQQNTTSTVDLTLTNSNTGNNITKGSRIRFRITDSAGTRKDVAYITALPYNFDSSTGDHLSFWTRTADSNPTEKVRITNTGNVGIGYTNPTDTLQVSGTIFSSSDMSLGGELNFHTPATKFIDFYTKDAALGTYAANMRLVNHDSTSFHSAVRMLRDGAVELYHNGIKRLETTTGGVTVGNAALGASIGNTLTIADFIHSNTNISYVRIRAQRNTATQDWTGASTKILHITDATEQGYIEFNPNGTLSGLALGQGATEFVRFTSTGNTGIGTTNPGTKLEVYGTSRFGGTTSVGRRADITTDGILTLAYGNNTNSSNLVLQNASDTGATTNHGSSILWQFGTSASTTAINAGRVSILKDQQWTATATTQDSYFAIELATDGVLTERFRITPDGAVQTTTTGGNAFALSIDGGIEIVRAAGSAYIDFKNSGGEDFDARIQETSGRVSFSSVLLTDSTTIFADNTTTTKTARLELSSVVLGTGATFTVTTNASGQISAISATPAAFGTNYAVGDVLSIDTPGTPSVKVSITVATIDPYTGGVTTFTAPTLPTGTGYTISQTNVTATSTVTTHANRTYNLPTISSTLAATDSNVPITIDLAPSATNAHLYVRGRSGAVQREGKIRLGGTFHTSADTGTRLIASIRSGFSAGVWGNEYLDFFLNNTTNDSGSDANQGRVMRLAYGGNVGIGSDAPGQKLDVTGSIRASSQLISTVATGTAPLAVSSTTLVSNLNADLLDGKHLTDVSRLVVTTATGGTLAADGANTWCKIATFATGTNQFADCTLLLGVTNTLSTLHDSAIISVFFRSNATNAAPTVDVEILSKGGTTSGHIVNDSFKVISGAWSTNMELWMKKAQAYGTFAIHELSARSQSGTLTYHDAAAWQAATPTGATNNILSDGTVHGLKIQAISAASAAGWVLRGNTIGIANESGVYQDASNNMQFAARDGSGTLRMVLDSNNTSGSYINTTAGFSIGKNTTTSGYTDLGTNLRVGITSQAATYSNAAMGTTITVTATNHGMTSGDSVWIDFTAGTAVDGYFNTVTVTNSSTFTVTSGVIAAANTDQACTLYTESQLRFPGAFGDGTSSYDHSIISERLWGGADKSELLIFKGNDSGTTIQDNIRLAAAGDIHFHTGFGSVQAATYTNYIASYGNTTASSTLSILASGGVCVNTGAGFSVGKNIATPGYTDLGTNLRIGVGAKAGTYTNTAASTTITVTCANHGIGVFNSVYIDFTGGTVLDAYFGVVQSTTQNTFTVTYPSAIPAANTNISCVVYPENQIRFPGQANDTGGNFDTTMITERSWGAFDKSELLIFKGGESGTSATQDNIRLAASGDIYFHTGFAGAGTTLYNAYTQTYGNTINSSTVSILSSGNVGIGTSNPTTNLHAWGNITNGGYDFVLGNTNQVDRGNSGNSRALIKDSSATLVVNFGGDFGGGVRIDGSLLMAPQNIARNVTNSNLILNGGTNATVGANIELYGSTHASQPNNAFYDGTTHTIRSVDGVNTFATINSSGLSPNALLIPYTEGAGTALTATAETTNQVLFPAAGDSINLGLGVYEVNMTLLVTRGATSATSSALRVNFFGGGNTAAGTFTGTAISTLADAGTANIFHFNAIAINTNNTVTIASTTVSGTYRVQITGIIKLTAGGTLIPTYGLTVALAGATTTTTCSASNYMRLLKISTSGTTTAQGGWG